MFDWYRRNRGMYSIGRNAVTNPRFQINPVRKGFIVDTSSVEQTILYLGTEDIRTLCREVDSIALMLDVFRLHGSRQTILPGEACLEWSTRGKENVRSLNMPGYVGGSFQSAGTKIINSNPENPNRGLPRASGLTLLFDPVTVQVRCVMESAYISALRTASVSVMCTDLLAAQNIECLTVIGAGMIGRTHIELAAKTIASLKRIVLFDLNSTKAHVLCRDLSTCITPSVEIEVSISAEEAVRNGDVVITATTTTCAYIRYGWLKSGAVVINVSLDDLFPEVIEKSNLLFVDDWNLIKSDSRRLLGQMHRSGSILGPNETVPRGGRRVDAEIGDLVLSRHPGRASREEIIVVNPFGLAIEDIAIASRVFEIAESRGIGTRLAR